MMHTFKSQDMQRHAAKLQEAAMKEPVVITYHDRPRLVLMSMEEYDRLRRRERKVGSAEDLPDSVAEELEKLYKAEETDIEHEPALSRGHHS